MATLSYNHTFLAPPLTSRNQLLNEAHSQMIIGMHEIYSVPREERGERGEARGGGEGEGEGR